MTLHDCVLLFIGLMLGGTLGLAVAAWCQAAGRGER